MILHRLQKRIHGLLPEVVALLMVGKRVGLVDEQHAAQRLFDDLARFGRGLPHVARHKSGAVDLDQLPL